MAYHYTNPKFEELVIKTFPSSVGIQIDQELIGVPHKDAPAVALAILEAAGISRDWDERVVTIQNPTTPEEHFAKALNHLDYGIVAQAKRAEREAEDTKVREFFNALDTSPIFTWGQLSEAEKDKNRARYRAARKFFEES